MKQNRLVTLTLASFCLFVLASFTVPSGKTVAADKNIVFKVSYDASTTKLVVMEKLEINGAYIQRSADGKITSINKDAILSEMPMAQRVLEQSMISKNNYVEEMYALVSFVSTDKAGLNMPSEQNMIDFLKISYDSFSKNAFMGSDYSVSSKGWNCSGPTCGMNVPAGLDVYVWK
jgi:hypothetical protein